VPREILEGVMAQESNWHQASPHAVPGIPGNPYIPDYYGFNKSGTIDYTQADCGYGLGQITDGMQAPSLSTPPSVIQQRVAVDYAENVAATAYFLTAKWDQLTTAGIVMNRNDPTRLEEWYFAVWAYNSGVNPQASTGGTGCTPSPNCHDG